MMQEKRTAGMEKMRTQDEVEELALARMIEDRPAMIIGG